MRFISTRGSAPALSFGDALLTGLAPDGGLYVPETLPEFSPADIARFANLSYTELACNILQPFVNETFDEKTLKRLVEKAYAPFRHAAIAPVTQIDACHYVLELFHGPTLAFKDFALQLLGAMMEELMKDEKGRAIVLGATSGDTGSAAISGLSGKNHLSIVILYPHGRPSDVQRRQMTTLDDANVHPLAVNGTFDDCQDLVKAFFSDADFRSRHTLLAVNSINIARVLAQIVYYVYAACALGAPARKVSFCVPPGNVGDVYAGYLAKCMGLPVERLIIATNSNDILQRCVATGAYKMGGVSETLSPSMDIQIASNFERLLFDIYGRDSARLNGQMQELRRTGGITLSPAEHRDLARDFSAHRIDDTQTLATMKRVYAQSGYVLDPHTAVGVASAYALEASIDGPIITLATAHGAKFPDAVKQACGITPALPHGMEDLMTKPERIIRLDADKTKLTDYLEAL